MDGEGHVREEGGDAVVAGPVVEAGVGVPLEELDVAFDSSERHDRLPYRIAERILLPAGAVGG